MVALFHLTHYWIHPLMLILALVTLPMLLWVKLDFSPLGWTAFGIMILISMVAPNALYVVSQRALHDDWPRRLLRLPMLMPLGMGMVASNTWAVLQGLRGPKGGEFVRTPKRGNQHAGALARVRDKEEPTRRALLIPLIQIALGLYTATGTLAYLRAGAWLVGPFLILYTIGFLYLGYRGLAEETTR